MSVAQVKDSYGFEHAMADAEELSTDTTLYTGSTKGFYHLEPSMRSTLTWQSNIYQRRRIGKWYSRQREL